MVLTSKAPQRARVAAEPADQGRPVSPKKALSCSPKPCELGLEGNVSKRESVAFRS
jgi:hypothetical protein